MTSANLLDEIITFLNFPPKAGVDHIRQFIMGHKFGHDHLSLTGDEGKYYSLLTRAEVLARQEIGEKISPGLLAAAKPGPKKKGFSLSDDHQYSRVFFPEDDDGQALKEAFRSVVIWFQAFMEGCTDGVMDVATLNSFLPTSHLNLEFKTTLDMMNPVLAPVGLLADDLVLPLEQSILLLWIYPFIFNNNGQALTKLRRCRQCGTFFRGQRLSATFCTTKCRMAYNYAHRAEENKKDHK